MMLNEVVLWVMGISALVGGIDRMTGCHLHLGEKFDEGFHSLGELALGMVGMLCLSPVLASALHFLMRAFFRGVHVDPSVLASVFCVDMGGFSLGQELCSLKEAGYYNGLFVAAMLGCTLTFTIPVAFQAIREEDKSLFSLGLLYGMAAVPVSAVLSGILARFSLTVVMVNSIFTVLISLLVVLCLKWIPDKTVRACICLGKGLIILTYIGLVAAVFRYLTGVVLIPGLAPIEEAMATVSACGVTLLGTFPFLELLVRILKRPLKTLGRKLKINEESVFGLVFTLANSVPVYKRMQYMDKKGIVVNAAWLVCATAALGDHLAFGSSVAPEYLIPLIAGKLAGGFLGVLFAVKAYKKGFA
jgi:ethanolamine transporter